ncbi:MAG: ATP-binding response regulator [Anaerolineae bacterium]
MLSGLPTDDVEGLRPRYFNTVSLVCGLCAWLLAARVTSWGPAWDAAWPAALMLLLGVAGGQRLYRRHFLPAAAVLSGAAATALLLQHWAVPDRLVLVMLPALAVLTAGMSAWLCVLVGVYALAGLAALDRLSGVPLFGPQWVLTASATALVSLAAITTARRFETAFDWARKAAQRAEAAARDAQKRREEAIAAVQALRNAYYLIERTNHAFAEAQSELTEARRMKTEFVNTVSHELRAPLNFIVGFSEMMATSPEVYGPAPWPPNLSQDIEEIYKSSEHLSRLIDDILDLAQIEAQRLVLKREPVGLADIAREAADMVRPWMQRKGLTFRESYEDDNALLSLDRTRVRQVVLNLLNNAARFTERGSVSLSVAMQGSQVVLTVKDTGPGIAAEQLPRVFEEFVQLDTGHGRAVGSSGLGLAICRRFVDMHGGRIWAESTVGEGSAFAVGFPLASRSPVLRTDTQSLGPGYWPTLQRQGLGRRIALTVAGEETVERLSRALTGHDVVRAAPEELAELVERVRPQAIIVDADVASVVAVEAVVDRSAHDVPLISFCQPTTQRDIPGVKEHLPKPVTRRRLLETLRRVCPGAERVMVVDDDPTMRRLLATALESAGCGYRVDTVASGRAALSRLLERPPHVLLLDLCLPDISGFEVLAAMRQDDLLRSVPVITVSAYVSQDDDHQEPPSWLSVRCKGPLGRTQLAALLNCALEEVPARYRWAELVAVPPAAENA